MMLEQETLYDKAKREYSSKLTEGRSRIPSVQVAAQSKSDSLPPLPMGWALKKIKKKVRFTKKQTEFLPDQFQKGEYSGQKSDLQEFSKTMSLPRDQVWGRRFQPDEVSRLLGKKRLEVTAAGNEAKASEVSEVDMESVDEDEISAEAVSHLSAVCANVMRDVAIQHPIVSFDLNICELVQTRTLTTLRVDRLRDICIDLGPG